MLEVHSNTAKAIARHNQMDIWFKLHEMGVDIGDHRYTKLQKNGYITSDYKGNKTRERKAPKHLVRDLSKKSPSEQIIDSEINIVDLSGIDSDIADAESFLKENKKAFKENKVPASEEVYKEDWKIKLHERFSFPKEFVEWIDSINSGFRRRKTFSRFELYKKQAEQWISENVNFTDIDDPEERWEFLLEEVDRMGDNTLYALNKYLWTKESQSEGGMQKYIAWEAQAIILYLLDCGLSVSFGKGRQIGFSTTIGGFFTIKVVVMKNLYCKFIAETKEKTEEIFNDKIKFAFQQLPQELKPSLMSDTGLRLYFGVKNKKDGKIEGSNSRCEVVAPNITAINGGSPDIVGVDEQGNIDILTPMLQEGLPAMLWTNPQTKKIEQRRQIILWGTGGADNGGKAMEREFMRLVSHWKKRNFGVGIVPVFFDKYARPGVDEESLKIIKAQYLNDDEMDEETAETRFNQHYPTTMEDMFLTSSKTLISIREINKEHDKIYNLPQEKKPKYGYMAPIYDQNSPLSPDVQEFTGLTHKLAGAEFVPLGDDNLQLASTVIFMEPDRSWINRYYKGTDPTQEDTGTSDFASAVWDAEINTVSAITKVRTGNRKEDFLQSLLLNIYYSPHGEGIPELVESNVGRNYMDYMDLLGFSECIIPNTMLPHYLATKTGNKDGISKKGKNGVYIISAMRMTMIEYGWRIFIPEYWVQAKTFVKKITQHGNATWGPSNKRYYKDDVMDGITYSKMAADAYIDEKPQNTRDPEVIARNAVRMKKKRGFVYDKNFNLVKA